MPRCLRLALAATALSILAGCVASGEVAPDRPVLVAPEAMRPAARPVDLPPRPLGLAEIERAWATDRAALAAAADANEALRAAIERRR